MENKGKAVPGSVSEPATDRDPSESLIEEADGIFFDLMTGPVIANAPYSSARAVVDRIVAWREKAGAAL